MLHRPLSEDLLHYLWKTKRIDYSNLQTTAGVPIKIYTWGVHNFDSGPDFNNSKIEIGDTLWAGNVEMHISSSDWHRHKHTGDPAYENVILHVVWEHDKEVLDSNGTPIPTLDISQYVNQTLINTYAALMQNELTIPCQKLIENIDLDRLNFWLHNILVERLQSKTRYLKELLEYTQNDWNQVFFISLGRYMGLKVNAEPFEQLATSFDLTILWKNRDRLISLEAILYGQAGMLQAATGDKYYSALRTEYLHLANKYKLTPISSTAWKFARMRPANFPTIRIAQLAAIIYKHDAIFSMLLGSNNLNQVSDLLKVSPSEYWNDHYRFSVDSKHKLKPVGDILIQILVINVVAPLLFLYGQEFDNDQYKEKAISYLENCKAESNKITRMWKDLGIKAKSAYNSQALIQLKTQYCDHKKCLSCQIGTMLLK